MNSPSERRRLVADEDLGFSEPTDVASDNKSRQEQSVGFLARYVYRVFAKAIAAELAPLGFVAGHWSVLRVLWREEGLSQVDLADRMRVEKSSLTGSLNSMERQGVILRERNSEDRRKMNIYLTPKGRRLKQSLLPYAGKINRRATKGMTVEEIEVLKTLMRKVIANLDS